MNMRNKIVLCGVVASFVVVLIVASVSVSAYDQKKILVDLTHAERVSIDGVTSPNLDTSTNGRIFDWQDWADYMRGQGYVIDVLTEGPITPAILGDYDLLIIAQPDVTTSGPAYFTAEESAAIGAFVENGGGLLLMGTQLVGGSTVSEFMTDYYTVYYYPEIHNALLANLGVGMGFAEGMIGPDPFDVLVEDDIPDQVGGPKGNIWMHTGDKTHPIWDSVTDGKFAYWHGCSINVTDDVIDIVATGDDDTYTSVKNSDYSPVVKPKGSYPVAIAAAEYGNGRIVAYGDAGCWQGKTPFGDSTFNTPKYHEQELAQNLIAYLTTASYKPTVSIYTDKTSYTTGDTMHVGLDITNLGDALPVKFAVWLEMPGGGIHVLTYASVTLPAGRDYSNPDFTMFTLPSIPAGTYTWNAALIEPSGPIEPFISHDTTSWEFVRTGAPTKDIARTLEHTTVAIDFGE